MQQAIGNEIGKDMSKNWGCDLGRSSRNLFHNKYETSGLTHGVGFVVTGSMESLLELKKRLQSVYPINANIIGAGSAKSIKALNLGQNVGERQG